MKATKDFSTYRPDGTVKRNFQKGDEVNLPASDLEALKKKGYFAKGASPAKTKDDTKDSGDE